MHFLRPEWFLALIPLIFFILLLRRSERKNSTWNRYIAPHLATLLVKQTNEIKPNKLWYLGLTWLVAVFALSGPAFTKQSLPVFQAAQGRVIVMDMSLSMYATDLSPNRLAQAKFKAIDLIDELKEGETGLIAYAGDAFTISPLTRDRATLLNLLPTLSPDIMPVRGSNLVAALTRGKNLLAQGGHIRGDILLLTDGVSTQQMHAAKAVLKDTQYRLAIIAFGSEQGSPIRLPDGQLLRDNADQIVVAKTNYSLLNELTQATDGILIPYRSDGQDLELIQDWLSTTGDTKATKLNGEIWQDAGPYIALLLLLPVLLSFRYGLAVIALFIVYVPNPVQASSWDNLWQTQDQQGMQAYQTEDYQQASESFASPQWQASALYKAGKYDEALSLFEQDTSATGLYNQGNTLMQKNKYDEAIERYQDALAQDPKLTAAKGNLDLAKKLAQQKQDSSDKNKSDQDKSDQDKSDQDKSDQDNSKQDKSNKNQESKQDNQQDKDSGKGKQQSKQDEQSQSNDSQQDSGSDKEGAGDQNPKEQSSENQSSKNKNNDADMQADPDKQQSQTNSQKDKQENEQASSDQQQAAQEQTNSQQAQSADDKPNGDDQPNAQSAQMYEGQETLPPEMERALKALVDDPQVLLRNKMQLEYQKRIRQNANSKEQQQW